MGFFDSKSKSSSASGQAGSQTQLGDPFSVNISAGDDQTASVSYSSSTRFTDYGAIDAALMFADNLANRDYTLQREEIQGAERLANRLAQAGVSVSDNLSARGDGFGRALLNSGESVSKYLVAASERTSDDIFNLSKQGLSFATDTIDTAERLAGDLLQTSQNQSNLVNQLAGTFQDFVNRENNPGERVNLYLIIAAAGVAGVFLLRGRK